MKLIPLTQGKYAQVDDADYDFLMQWKWQAQSHHNIWYAKRNISKNGKFSTFKMHRLLLGLTDTKRKCDHIDHNGLNNQRSNLRECSHKENMYNRKKKKGCNSKYVGVSVTKVVYKTTIRAKICKDNVHYRLGIFKTEELAAHAYNEKAKELFGEFAYLNVIPQ